MAKRDERYVQQWEEIEKRFPGSSAAFDRDLGDRWLDGRDGPRFDQYGEVLMVFAGDSDELGHQGPWSSAYYEPVLERWQIKKDFRVDAPPSPQPDQDGLPFSPEQRSMLRLLRTTKLRGDVDRLIVETKGPNRTRAIDELLRLIAWHRRQR